jgi:predicted amidohydrolase YtcJ
VTAHPAADLVLLGGDLRVLAPGAPAGATALAVRGGTIAAVGADAEIAALAGPRTRRIALGGRTVLPGINESHAHLGWWSVATAPGSLDLRADRAPDIAAVQRLVAGAAARTAPGTWITGMGWDASRLADGRAPHRADLDAVAPHHPVALTHFSGHVLWANSAALALAGIDRGTVAPAGSVVVCDERGEPTGVLVEPGATGMIARCLPPPSAHELAGLLEGAIAGLHARGITSLTEPALAPGDPDRAFTGTFIDAYMLLAREGRLALRVNVLELFHRHGVTSAADVAAGLAAPRDLDGIDPRLLRIGGVKLFADGVFSGRTSWVHEPYAGGGRGSLVLAGATDDERVAQLREAVRVAHAAGRQVQVHATGDAAVDATVAALVDAGQAHPRDDARHVVIHGVLTGRATLAAMAAHGIALNAQPTIARRVGDGLFALLGEERASRQSPLRDAADAGVPVALSTDIPILPEPDWRATVADAVERRTDGGRVVDQRLTLDEALAGVTAAGAWQDHAETWKGALGPGLVADLCVLDGDLRAASTDELRAMDVAATFLAGDQAYSSGALG